MRNLHYDNTLLIYIVLPDSIMTKNLLRSKLNTTSDKISFKVMFIKKEDIQKLAVCFNGTCYRKSYYECLLHVHN